MTVNSYLTNLTNAAIIRDEEKASIQRSINTLSTRLTQFFGTGISSQFIFGSYSRGTILPRSMDSHSDIDYMIVFSENKFSSQTYLNKLHQFADKYYSRSEIFQSNPTIVLNLNHIKFELVPAVDQFIYGLHIPAKASANQQWIQTAPHDFNAKLTEVNQSCNNVIKPLIRLVKYWNAVNDYPFESFNLEQNIALNWTNFFMPYGKQLLKDYFFKTMTNLSIGYMEPKWKQDAVARAKILVKDAVMYETRGCATDAEYAIKKLLPPLA